MSWRRNVIEAVTWLVSRVVPSTLRPPAEPGSIFVLRNNDIGDLLVVTPLFDALKRHFPRARIVAGIGDWNFDVLKDNPHVDDVVPVNAPWHNQQIQPQGVAASLRYIVASEEVKNLARQKFDIGIDVLGSAWGSLLMMRCKIPFRLGVRGYAGGHTAVQRYVEYGDGEHVGRQALKFAELLGASSLPPNRPQLFLDGSFLAAGEAVWRTQRRRILIAPGGGFSAKCWAMKNYVDAAKMLGDSEIVVIGAAKDRDAALKIQAVGGYIHNLTAQLDLRTTFAVIAAADLVICNSSMAMHAAAAFRKPCYVMLGEFFRSARQHAAQWGHSESQFFGYSEDHPRLGTVEELIEAINERAWEVRDAAIGKNA